MKNYLFLFILFLVYSCTSRAVYWCGDHPCINNKEKESYFKKTMIVEVKEFKKESYEDKSDIEKLLRQARIDEKKRIFNEKELAKQAKQEEKRRIKEEKELAKQAKLEEKRRIKEEKELVKEIELEEDKLIKYEKIESNKNIDKEPKKKNDKNIELSNVTSNIEINSNEFSKIYKKIIKKNSSRPYPDVNNLPN